jgi:saccharopine dehydrogenase (NADP+, L-glutamate forming)/spermidine synthase
MKHVLVFGAGLVAKPLVRYLLDQAGFQVTVASRTLNKAEALIGDHPQGIRRGRLSHSISGKTVLL